MTTASASASPIVILAGAGRFPFYVAQEAKRMGRKVIIFALSGWADPSLAAQADAHEELAVGHLGRLITRLHAHGVTQGIMAGKVTKRVLLESRATFDQEMLALLAPLKEFSVSSVLGAIAKRLAAEGVTLLDSSILLHSALCPPGPLTSRRPTTVEEADIRLGAQVARAMAALDVGQTVVVKQGVVIAVEALEGTDAAIRRAHALAGEGLVVVKTAAATQDRRFDLPFIAAGTLAVLQETHASCLAVEAGSTLLLERDEWLPKAEASNICVVGIDIPTAS